MAPKKALTEAEKEELARQLIQGLDALRARPTSTLSLKTREGVLAWISQAVLDYSQAKGRVAHLERLFKLFQENRDPEEVKILNTAKSYLGRGSEPKGDFKGFLEGAEEEAKGLAGAAAEKKRKLAQAEREKKKQKKAGEKGDHPSGSGPPKDPKNGPGGAGGAAGVPVGA